MADAVLALNTGSSSLKFALFPVPGRDPLAADCRGVVERLDGAPRFLARDGTGAALDEKSWEQGTDTGTLLTFLLDWVGDRLGRSALVGVGHRIVHGGQHFVEPALLTPEAIEALDRLTPLAPLHQPLALRPIRALAALRPGLPQVGCFDTAFHHAIAPPASRYALPRAYEAGGIRRYGFHGLSYEYIAGRLAGIAPALASGRTLVAHLGNGCSLCAMQGGRSVDTTMGFSALDGLMMGTRCGAIDPGILIYLQREEGLSVDALEDLLYRRSGLLGVSGLSGDMRMLEASADPLAAEALDLFAFMAAREMAAMATTLGGLDGIVFTGGIGEHAAPMRASICTRLAWLGVEIDAASNAAGAGSIGAASSRIEVRIIPTDEETTIGRHVLAALGLAAAG